MASPTPAESTNPAPIPYWLGLVRKKVESLQFGIVQLIVHEGRVTQIERTEKMRLSMPRDGADR